MRQVDTVAVYGRLHGIAIFELLATADEGPAPAWVAPYEQGLAAYAGRNWSEAITLFEQVVKARGADRPAATFIARCRKLLAAPPPATWSPVTVLDEK